MKSPVFRTSLFGSIVLAALFVVRIGADEPGVPGTKDERTKKSAPITRAEAITDSRRQALQLLADAEVALEGGQTARATTLGREAQRLYPESKAIAGFLATIDADTPALKIATPTYNRAKAHLAAALTRAQVLLQQRRYTEALDLLNGIVEAAEKFPASADVSLYRDLAQKELIEYRIGVQTGKVRPNSETPLPRVADTSGTDATTPTPEFPAAPSNAYRLARIAKEQSPAWYTRLKTALRRPISVDYRAMPLGLVLDDIHEAIGVPVIVDAPVQAAKTPQTALVDLRVSTVPAETVLSLAVQVAGCEYVLLEKGVIVTTPDKAGDYIRLLPDAVTTHWARMRHLFPDLYVDAMANRPLPEAKPGDGANQEDQSGSVPMYLRSGRDLVADIEQLTR